MCAQLPVTLSGRLSGPPVTVQGEVLQMREDRS
jgi:hypothetical protein